VKQRTAKSRFTRAIKRVREWCAKWRHLPLREQHRALSKKLRGHYAYYGITGNSLMLNRFMHAVRYAWRFWLQRRSQRGRLSWLRFTRLLATHPLPRPRIVHSIYGASAKP